MAMSLKPLLRVSGEEFVIRRGYDSHEALGLDNRDSEGRYIGFEPDVDICAGDVVTGTVSQKEFHITHVDRGVFGGKLFQLKAYHQSIPAHPMGIHVGSMVNSAIQMASPGAVQSVEVTMEYRESVNEVIDTVASLLGKIDLASSQRSDLEADIETIQSQLKATKPKRTVIRECLSSIKSTLQAVSAAGGTYHLVQELLPQLAALCT